MTEVADVSMYKEGTDGNRKLWEAAERSLPDLKAEKAWRAFEQEQHTQDKQELPKLRGLPAEQIERLKETKDTLEGIYQRFGIHLTPEINGLLAQIHSGISNAISLDSLGVNWEDESTRKSSQTSYIFALSQLGVPQIRFSLRLVEIS